MTLIHEAELNAMKMYLQTNYEVSESMFSKLKHTQHRQTHQMHYYAKFACGNNQVMVSSM